jgi:uncharacterized protein (TIGR02328 family)
MRLWHYEIIPYLPQKQLISQWRELSAIVGSIIKKGTPNHLLVNKVMDYSYSHLREYTEIIMNEMLTRNYKPSIIVKNKIINFCEKYTKDTKVDILYPDWHNRRYLNQCMYNLQEKYDCGGITQSEWDKLLDGYNKITGEFFK